MTDLYSNLCCCVGKAKFGNLLVLQKGVDRLDGGAERHFPQGNGKDCPERAALLQP